LRYHLRVEIIPEYHLNINVILHSFFLSQIIF